MRAFLGRRFLSFVVTLFVASFGIFLLLRCLPGDPAQHFLKYPTPEKLAEVRTRFGLDRPLPVQYTRWLENLIRGSFGRSFRTGREVTEDLARYWPATAELTLVAMALAIGCGVALGAWAASRRGTWADIAGTAVSLIGLSTPIFWLGLLAILFFSLELGWLPPGDRLGEEFSIPPITGFLLIDALLRGDFAGWTSAGQHLILPALTLATVPGAFLARITRSAVADALDQEFIRSARAKGVSDCLVLWRHAVRAAAGSIATMGNVQLSYLLGGAVLTETVFSWPGLGRYVADAIVARDYPAIQGTLVALVVGVMMLNLLGDLLQVKLDPRLRTEK